MKLVELTLPMHGPGHPRAVARLRTVTIRKSMTYVATQYDFAHDSMQGTYLDFPGHVVETDDGTDADNYPLSKLAAVPAAVLHLDRSDRSGAVSADELERVCPPLSGRAGLIGRAARDRQMEVSFFNVAMSSEIASQLLLEMQADGLKPRFTFSAAGFVRAGEEPFLKSYKRKLRRFVDQLDVADATFEGAAAPLAGGNGEIKEMISILRCASFEGWFTLTSGGPDGESLRQTCGRFMRLLDQM